MPLGDVLPEWDKREQHSITTTASPDRVIRAIEELTWNEVRVFRMLMSVRFRFGDRFPAGEPVMGWFHDSGFVVIDRGSDRLVLGLLQPVDGTRVPPAVTDPVGFRTFEGIRSIKIAVGFRVSSGTLVTETRVLSSDARLRRAFSAYWTVIRPFSGVIRREWLRAIRRRAELP